VTDYIERRLDLPGPPRMAWRFLVEPDLLAQWLADEVTLDLRPGGEAAFRLGAERRTGWVENVKPPAGGGAQADEAELVFWWQRRNEPVSRVRVTLTPAEDGQTTLRIVETRPLEILDLVGLPQPGHGHSPPGPSLVAS
jgi:uncharacterized protein YndB with AHSA1/START domain